MAAKQNFRSNAVREEAKIEEFIPFACHYDPSTLLTKNGELLQTIKITGFSFESVNKSDGSKKMSLRSVLRKDIIDNITSDEYALWIHTVRRRKDLTTGGAYPEGGFADYLNKSWCKRNDWANKYMNELYVTVIREGERFGNSPAAFARSLNFKAERKRREKYLKKSCELLNDTVEKILEGLRDYGARRLSMFEHEGTTYSEPLQFFGKILNLAEIPMPAPVMDISQYLPSHKTLFGFNTIEVNGSSGRHFAAVLSVKEYHEVTSTAIDEFLQLDQQFVITETFDFINNNLVQTKFEHQKYILSLSEDEKFGDITGLNDITKNQRGRATDFGEHQIVIVLTDDDLTLLQKETEKILSAFHSLGIVTVREDVMMEDCYWSQLPGNFEFLRRLSPINSRRIGGFASLYNFPAGKLSGNHWGDAVTVFYTRANTPYFFNFHDIDNGHTAIIGPYGAGKTVLLNFLVSQAIKFDPNIYFFDQYRASEIFIRAIDGTYKRILKDTRSSQIKFNPFKLPNTEESRKHLKQLIYFMMMDEDMQLPEKVKDEINQAVEYNYQLPENERRLSVIAKKFWPVDFASVQQEMRAKKDLQDAERKKKSDLNTLLQTVSGKMKEEANLPEVVPGTPEGRLSLWYGDGRYAHFFDNVNDEINFVGKIHGFDITEIVQEKWPAIPIFSYIFHRINISLNGNPTIIVLDEAWKIIDNPVFAARIGKWLEELKHKNAMVIFATESVDDVSKSSITNDIIRNIATQILLPNKDATSTYKTVFGLSEREFDMLNAMEKKERHFLLKHHGDAVVAKLNLSGMNDIMAILSGNRENIALLESVILEVGNNPKKWLPAFSAKFGKL